MERDGPAEVSDALPGECNLYAECCLATHFVSLSTFKHLVAKQHPTITMSSCSLVAVSILAKAWLTTIAYITMNTIMTNQTNSKSGFLMSLKNASWRY